MKTTIHDTMLNDPAVQRPLRVGDRGDYILSAIPPYCREVRIPSTLVEIRADGTVLLKDDGMKNYYVHTTAESFVRH